MIAPGRIVRWALVPAVLVGLLAWRASGPREKWFATTAWSASGQVQMAVPTPVRPGTAPLLLTHGPRKLAALDPAGKVVAELALRGPLSGRSVAATGDIDGDGAEDIVLAAGHGSTIVVAVDAAMRELWRTHELQGLGAPERVLAVDLDGDGRRETVVGDRNGKVRALTSKGRATWDFAFAPLPKEGEIRALDDLALGNERVIVAARRSGEVAILDRAGRKRAGSRMPPLRRLRVFDSDGDGKGEAHAGRDDGTYATLDASGKEVVIGRLDESITDLRPVEVDGDPRTREVLLGDKGGGVALFAGRRELARMRVGARVASVSGVDIDGDGRDELFVGTETGGLHVFDGDGVPLLEQAVGGNPERITGFTSALRDRLVIVAAGTSLTALRLTRRTPPGWYRPAVAAVLGWLAIAGAVLLLARRPPPVAVPADPRVRAVDAAVAHINDLVSRGVVRAEQAAARLRQLERQAARATAAPVALSPPPPTPPARKG